MVKVKQVEITNSELSALENLVVAWNLCEKHNRETYDKSDVEIFKLQNSCKACQNKEGKMRNKALHLWSKLIHAYEIARHGKCGCEIK
ncbi:MAG: hypothetical protein V1722_04380 [Candidatus Micrarchaeota archaeon]